MHNLHVNSSGLRLIIHQRKYHIDIYALPFALIQKTPEYGVIIHEFVFWS